MLLILRECQSGATRAGPHYTATRTYLHPDPETIRKAGLPGQHLREALSRFRPDPMKSQANHQVRHVRTISPGDPEGVTGETQGSSEMKFHVT